MDDDDDGVEVPDHFICPISLQIMKDPVTAPTGITYDRKSIEKWLSGGLNATCPLTKLPLPTDSVLTPNHTLRRLIHSWSPANESQGRLSAGLMRDGLIRELRLEAMGDLEAFLLRDATNGKSMADSGVPNGILKLIIRCFRHDNTSGLEQALRILFFFRSFNPSSSESWRQLIVSQTDLIIDSFVWVLGLRCIDPLDEQSNWRNHAVIALRTIMKCPNSSTLQSLKQEFFQRIVLVVRQGIPQEGINAALHMMLEACPWGRNRIKLVESGAVFELIELELRSPRGKRTTEMTLGVLSHLCSCADGRAQFVSHAAGIAVVTKRMMNVSPTADDRAVMILSQVCRFSSGRNGVLQAMLSAGAVTKLCTVIQVDRGLHLKEKVREHYHVWKNSPCIQLPLFTRRHA